MNIKLENLSKVYHKGPVEILAISGVNLNIESGELAVLIGVSGSGKSTLLNLIGGLDSPTSGVVTVDSVDLSTLDSESLAVYRREKVGFIFQFFNLIPTLTVLENVMLPLVPLKLSGSKKREKALQVIEKVGMTERLEHLPGELSGGEQQRVAIARAIVNDPKIILADEPTSDLDTKTGQRIVELLQGLNREGRTVILASHDPRVAGVASHQVIMEDGRIVEEKRG